MRAPVAQWIERWPPEPGAWVRVPPGVLFFSLWHSRLPAVATRLALVVPFVGEVGEAVQAELGAEGGEVGAASAAPTQVGQGF